MVQPRPGHGQRGSFGIPPEMAEGIDEARKAKEQEESQSQAQAPGAEASPEEGEPDENFPDVKDKLPNDKTVEDTDPMNLLKGIGVELNEEDLHKLLFQGAISKKLTLFTKPHMTATLKTLTGEEYDLVDELLAEDIEKNSLTRDGVQVRRSMWILAFGVQELQGKKLRKEEELQTKEDGTPDLKAKARLYRETLGKLSGGVLTKLTRLHGTLSVAINQIIENPDSPFLNNA